VHNAQVLAYVNCGNGIVAAQAIAVSISDWSRIENNLPAIVAALARDPITLALYAVAIY
jgi:hypothetical protein